MLIVLLRFIPQLFFFSPISNQEQKRGSTAISHRHIYTPTYIHIAIMQFTASSTLLTLAAVFAALPVHATVDPCTSNTKGVCPSSYSCSASKVSKAIQAAECSHNTRTSDTQTFAVFVTDHDYDDDTGAPYGTCSAYTCTAPTNATMTDTDSDCWTFFWGTGGTDSGVGTGCIKDPDTGDCGCEDSDGTFISGSDSCT